MPLIRSSKTLAAGLAAILAAGCWAGLAPAAEPWIAVVVPAQARHETLTLEGLAQIYKRKKLFWDNGQRIQPVNLPADHSLRQRFSRAVLKQPPEALEDYWNQLYFQGLQPPYVLASTQAVLRFVGSTEQAIGYVSACEITAQLRVLLLIDADRKPRPPETSVDCPAG